MTLIKVIALDSAALALGVVAIIVSLNRIARAIERLRQ